MKGMGKFMPELTDNQKMIQKTMDVAAQLVVDYAAPEVPALENLTPDGLCEMFGRLNEARKAVEKVEKIVRGRFESQIEGKKEFRGENFNYKKEDRSRSALDQQKAKDYLQEQGILDDFMSHTEVPTVTIKRN